MSFVPLNSVFAQAAQTNAQQIADWAKAWRVAVESGSQDTLVDFVCRESGMTEEHFLQHLATVLKWPFIDLRKTTVPTEARNAISTKVAFQYNAIPIDAQNGTLVIAVSNPFDTGMLNAVQFDARKPVKFALATKGEIEKALKKYYGVGAETLDELAKDDDEPIDLDLAADRSEEHTSELQY